MGTSLKQKLAKTISNHFSEVVVEKNEESAKEEIRTIPKDLLMEAMLTEYNVMLTKMNQYNLSGRDIQMARDKMEESFLWFRCAVEKSTIAEV